MSANVDGEQGVDEVELGSVARLSPERVLDDVSSTDGNKTKKNKDPDRQLLCDYSGKGKRAFCVVSAKLCKYPASA